MATTTTTTAAPAGAQHQRAEPWRHLVPVVLFVVVCKTVLYGNFRLVYGVSSYLEKDWGLSDTEMGLVLSMGDLTSAVSSFFMACFDRIPSPRALCVALQLACGVSSGYIAVMPATPSLGALLASRGLFGFFLNVLVVTLQTNVLEGISSLTLRDKVTSAIEVPWSTSVIVAVPLMAVAYSRGGWRLPFMVLAGLMVFLAPAYVVFLSSKRAPQKRGADPTAGFRWKGGALLFQLSGFCWGMSTNLVFTQFALALRSFNLDEAEAGSVGLVLGLSEFLGAFASGWFSGNEQSLEISSLVFVFALAVYGVLRTVSVELAIVGMFLTLVPTEIGILQRFSRAALFGSKPDASVLLATLMQFMYAGRAVGAVVAPAVPLAFGADLFLVAGLAGAAAAFAWGAKRVRAASRVSSGSEDSDVELAEGGRDRGRGRGGAGPGSVASGAAGAAVDLDLGNDNDNELNDHVELVRDPGNHGNNSNNARSGGATALVLG